MLLFLLTCACDVACFLNRNSKKKYMCICDTFEMKCLSEFMTTPYINIKLNIYSSTRIYEMRHVNAKNCKCKHTNKTSLPTRSQKFIPNVPGVMRNAFSTSRMLTWFDLSQYYVGQVKGRGDIWGKGSQAYVPTRLNRVPSMG